MILTAVSILAITGCASPRSDGILFGGTASDMKAYLDNYAHVLLACVTSDVASKMQLPEKPEVHFRGVVVRVYKGDWQVSERIAWFHSVEDMASLEANRHVGELFFVFTNKRTGEEIYLDTGDGPRWSDDFARQVESAMK